MSLFVPNNIEKLARGIMATLSPLTGERASGIVSMTATDADVVIPKNTYLAPVKNNGILQHYLFKVAANPATEDGSWTITSDGVEVPLVSNIGGERHNQPDGTRFVFVENPPGLEGIEPEIYAVGDFTWGDNSGSVRQVVFYEDLDTQKQARDFFDASLGKFPGILIAWNSTEPLEGRTFGASKGATRAGRKSNIQREVFQIYVVTSKKESDPIRRRAGMDIMQDATVLLVDTMASPDGELLNVFGNGMDINQRSRAARGTNSYIYVLNLRVSTNLQRCEFRQFNPWITMHYKHLLETDGVNPERALVDIKASIPQD